MSAYLKSVSLVLVIAFCIIGTAVAQTESMTATTTTADEDTTVTGL